MTEPILCQLVFMVPPSPRGIFLLLRAASALDSPPVRLRATGFSVNTDDYSSVIHAENEYGTGSFLVDAGDQLGDLHWRPRRSETEP